MTDRIRAALNAPVDIASLAVFRVLFGLLLVYGLTRFMAAGWIETLYVEPTFFFKYYGLEWVRVWPRAGMYLHYGALVALALCVAAGLFYRAAIVLFCLGFAYVQAMDVTNYLNHYYLVVLMAGLMSILPMQGAFSIDAWRRPGIRRDTVPAWMLYLLRFQVAVVYVHAGLAKVGSDWLLHAQPMNLWLTARIETPILGPWLDRLWTAYAMSWAGCLYDTFIVAFLLWPRTRPLAYLAVLVFHFLTRVFFDIGMFPFIMVTVTTLFFSPSWPRRWMAAVAARFPRRASPGLLAARPAQAEVGGGRVAKASGPRAGLRRAGVAMLALYCAFQMLFPLRHLLYPGDVIWNERGMRFAWKVMLREKNGSITYHVRQPATGRVWQVSPSRYLTWRQANEMSGQPDQILQLAHHIARDFETRGLGKVEVRVEALVSVNGRPPTLLIDPKVDLVRIEDGIGVASWILPAPDTAPIQLRPSIARVP